MCVAGPPLAGAGSTKTVRVHGERVDAANEASIRHYWQFTPCVLSVTYSVIDVVIDALL